MERLSFRLQIYGSWFLVNFILCLLPLGLSLIMKNSNVQGIFLSLISYSYTLIIGGFYLYETYKKSDTSLLLKYVTWFMIILLIAFYCLYPHTLILPISELISTNLLSFSLGLIALVFFIFLFLNFKELEYRVDKDFNEFQIKKSKGVTNNYKKTFEEVRDGI